MIVVVMGVSGSGKSTIGQMLATVLNCSFQEGDALHPAANVAKMSAGTPLTDEDRGPWLAAVHSRIRDSISRGEDLVVACSALKREYRQSLATGVPITWVYLQASKDLIRSRLTRRTSHFMKADMLDQPVRNPGRAFWSRSLPTPPRNRTRRPSDSGTAPSAGLTVRHEPGVPVGCAIDDSDQRRSGMQFTRREMGKLALGAVPAWLAGARLGSLAAQTKPNSSSMASTSAPSPTAIAACPIKALKPSCGMWSTRESARSSSWGRP